MSEQLFVHFLFKTLHNVAFLWFPLLLPSLYWCPIMSLARHVHFSFPASQTTKQSQPVILNISASSYNSRRNKRWMENAGTVLRCGENSNSSDSTQSEVRKGTDSFTFIAVTQRPRWVLQPSALLINRASQRWDLSAYMSLGRVSQAFSSTGLNIFTSAFRIYETSTAAFCIILLTPTPGTDQPATMTGSSPWLEMGQRPRWRPLCHSATVPWAKCLTWTRSRSSHRRWRWQQSGKTWGWVMGLMLDFVDFL